MPAPVDIEARARALQDLGHTLLVEAGAGTGKTSLMAGRVVALLARGAAPRSIAAVTFTELAASELAQRISVFLDQALARHASPELQPAFPNGVSDEALANLRAAREQIDEIVCTTIHGFCQAMIRPYPVEARMDPGAKIIDPAEAEIVYGELFDQWLRVRFDGQGQDDDVLVEMLSQWGDGAVERIRQIADVLRRNRTARPPAAEVSLDDIEPLRAAVAAWRAWYDGQPLDEPESRAIIEEFEVTLERVGQVLANGAHAAALVELSEPPRQSCMHKDKFSFTTFRRKKKWEDAAKAAGFPKIEGERHNAAAMEHYEACCVAFTAFFGQVSAALLHRFAAEFAELTRMYADRKRAAALLDFDDLIYKALDVLSRNADVRDALSERFRHILVDEFQDTDPLQCEIFWRLSGTPSAAEPDARWSRWPLRPGQLFLVGDPKQSIYRFRGADVHAYLEARDAITTSAPDSILRITHNFRSLQPILDWVNARFEVPVQAQELEFQPLTGTEDPRPGSQRVVALDVAIDGDSPKSEDLREGEAAAVADLCRRLIGELEVRDKDGFRPCQAGDIALLAPSGTDLYVYERQLELRDVPIASQAGKGFFRRQEVQDLIAITRVLADARDTLALGALLRGPLVGMTEERLLDVVQALPRPEGAEDRIPRLTLWTPADHIIDPICHHVIETLQGLARRARRTTPYALLADAVAALHVRPLLEQRHRGEAERALANVDLYLEQTHPYSVRGLRAFARHMRRMWEDDERQAEGRPDAEAEAVQVITMHSAKGLEWPVVIPINTMTAFVKRRGPLIRRNDDTLHMRLGGILPTAYTEVEAFEDTEEERQQVRLWYVGVTRARDLLVVPRLSQLPRQACWMSRIDLVLAELPAVEVDRWAETMPAREAEPANNQDRETFAREAAAITAMHRSVTWRQPSLHEGGASAELEPVILAASEEERAVPQIRGGTARGLVLHKLIEEILTGETGDAEVAMTERAGDLLGQLGLEPSDDPATGYSPAEIAASVARALALPEVAAVRTRLLPELPVAATILQGNQEVATSGIADAVATDDTGRIDTVVDWKSDVDPSSAQRALYREQVRDYMAVVGADRGLIVYATEGSVDQVGQRIGPAGL